jgi:hypothetical protein
VTFEKERERKKLVNYRRFITIVVTYFRASHKQKKNQKRKKEKKKYKKIEKILEEDKKYISENNIPEN